MKLTFIALIAFPIFGFCQTPATDPHWIKDNTASDEFNYNQNLPKADKLSLLRTKWRFCYNGTPSDEVGYHTQDGSNVDFDNGILTLLAKKAPGNYTMPCTLWPDCWLSIYPALQYSKSFDYTSADISSYASKKYGYFEIS
jgi:hypothetical protein